MSINILLIIIALFVGGYIHAVWKELRCPKCKKPCQKPVQAHRDTKDIPMGPPSQDS